ncbi:MAG: hypothetical protein A2600_11805 [Candidatus Lambdaproteobacteria bacterium RIFOXYD1_FULL_56_27]|nr:MAG: hypothetical protein A2426_12140 [Candidatus Lambdaproteobacteria bacterium RIFOXYC1_FULL_56_13]OGH08029.1 MAG: hypothetical protein A2600_11805 [Candidatus Lambdaproteobacteria bacterium RIFOXYD1_FULL_56_27]
MKSSLQRLTPRPLFGHVLPPSPSLSLASSVGLSLALKRQAVVQTFGLRLVALRVRIKSRPQSQEGQ